MTIPNLEKIECLYGHIIGSAYIKTKYLQKQKGSHLKRVNFWFLKKHLKIRAFVSVIFKDNIEIKCRIMQGAICIGGIQIKKMAYG